MSDLQIYLSPGPHFDFESTEITAYLQDTILSGSQRDQAIQLYEKVRDDFQYNPYHLDIRPEVLRASKIIAKRKAWCVEKAIVLIACLRKIGIPARPGYSIVTNHIGVEKLTAYLKRPEIVFHGYVELFLNDEWIKCTPAFDKRLCRLTNVEVLNFNGKTDSLFQQYTGDQKFMEYLHDYGSFPDVPHELMHSEMQKYYPHLFEQTYDSKEFSFRHKNS